MKGALGSVLLSPSPQWRWPCVCISRSRDMKTGAPLAARSHFYVNPYSIGRISTRSWTAVGGLSIGCDDRDEERRVKPSEDTWMALESSASRTFRQLAGIGQLDVNFTCSARYITSTGRTHNQGGPVPRETTMLGQPRYRKPRVINMKH